MELTPTLLCSPEYMSTNCRLSCKVNGCGVKPPDLPRAVSIVLVLWVALVLSCCLLAPCSPAPTHPTV
jgi:hypothetical protein